MMVEAVTGPYLGSEASSGLSIPAKAGCQGSAETKDDKHGPANPSRYSRSTFAYVAQLRGGSNLSPNWFDVAAAYDAGMKHGIEAKQSAKRQIRLQNSGMSAGPFILGIGIGFAVGWLLSVPVFQWFNRRVRR
jgi:hypothetical protein